VIEKPGEDVVYIMETCAEYFEANSTKIAADWQKLLTARAEYRRLAAIEAAKPKPPPEPPRVLKVARKPGSGVPGKLRDMPIGGATSELPVSPVESSANPSGARIELP
jgi:hypothetical protein